MRGSLWSFRIKISNLDNYLIPCEGAAAAAAASGLEANFEFFPAKKGAKFALVVGPINKSAKLRAPRDSQMDRKFGLVQAGGKQVQQPPPLLSSILRSPESIRLSLSLSLCVLRLYQKFPSPFSAPNSKVSDVYPRGEGGGVLVVVFQEGGRIETHTTPPPPPH